MISPRRSLTMTITITAFERSPDGGKGLARDTRVRWALEEVGQPYEVRPVSFRAMKEPAHRALHPFGQIPTYEQGDLALFETGARAGATATSGFFRAPHAGTPPFLKLEPAGVLEGEKPGQAEPLPLVEDR